MLIDSHAHLEMREFDADREEVIRRAGAAGVDRIVTVGTNLNLSARPPRLAENTKTFMRRWAFIPMTWPKRIKTLWTR